MRHLLLAVLLACTAVAMAQNYEQDYLIIDSLAGEGKFRSALEAADALYSRTADAGDEDEMLKALAYRASYTNRLEEDGYEATLQLLNRELGANQGRPVVEPVLAYLVGMGYYNYARRNSYRLRNATAVEGDDYPAAGTPLEDWTLAQLKDAAEAHLLGALETAAYHRTRLAEIPAIISGDEEAHPLRPTLFDLLAYGAMDALTNPLLTVGDANVPDPERFLVPALDFVQLDLSALPAGAGTTRRLSLLQKLLSFHLTAPPGTRNERARLHVDRQRIQFVNGLGVNDPVAMRTVYERMHENYTSVPGRGMLLVDVARLLQQADEETFGPLPRQQALDLLKTVRDDDPGTRVAVSNLTAEILQTQLNVTVQESYGRADNLLIQLRYRNVERVYHRLVPLKPNETPRSYGLDEEDLEDYLSRFVVARRDYRMPVNDDYRFHTTETWLPTAPAGGYVLLTSTDPDFDLEKGTVAVTPLRVTDLAVVEHKQTNGNFYEVLDRATGAPRPGLTVNVFEARRRNSDWRQVRTLTTDRRGRFSKPLIEGARIRFVVLDPANDDSFDSAEFYSYNRGRNDRDRSRDFTPLFTDRAIYRPGQTLHVYGITARKDNDAMPNLIPNRQRTLTLYDANGQEVDQVEVTSDAFSRFNHSFRLPAGGLTGNFRVQTDGGSVSFRVEEYKRPKFTVAMEAPAFVVAGDTAEVTGKATLFAGPGLDGAKVSYRIYKEEVRYYWYGYGRGAGGGGDREAIASGETETDGQGEFAVSFVAEPLAGGGRTRFRYVVEADVSDDTGETHPASASVSLRSDQPVVSLTPENDLLDVTDTLVLRAGGTEDDLTITYRVLPVRMPGATLYPRSWAFPDRPVLEREEYQEHFPKLADRATPGFKQWTAATPVVANRLKITQGKGSVRIDLSGYPAGHYKIEWNYPDGTFGEPSHVRVMDLERGRLPAGMLYHVAGLDQRPVVGQPLTLRVVSMLPLPVINYRFGSRKGITTETTSAGNTTTITYPVTDADRGGLDFSLSFVRNGDLHHRYQRFALPWDNKQLTVDYATFRDKLRPGTPERWTLTVKNADGTPVAAAALASMYDASLDDIYAGGGWQFSPFPGYYGSRNQPQLLRGGTSNGIGQTRMENTINFRAPTLPKLNLPFNWFYSPRAYDAVAYSYAPAPQAMRRSAARKEAGGNIEMVADEEAIEMEAPRTAAPPPPPPPPTEPGAADDAATEPPVNIRTNLRETAFWFPELTANAAGELTMTFDSPEALTTWKFRVFAHDKELNSSVSEREVVTQKELMVLPNVPRFLREGDALELTARVNNLSETDLDVTATVEFFDPATGAALTELGGAAGAMECEGAGKVAAGTGTTFCFPLSVPEGLSLKGAIGYRVVARGGNFSDGEENVIPILTDRTMVTVSKPFYLKKEDTKTVTVAGLGDNDSPTLRHVGYTFQATTQPAWIALKSLPYLMEYPYDCTEQIANRFFANQLAYATVSSKPILEEVFRQWEQDSTALLSELQRNEKLKNALLTETPWVRAAQSEAEQRARIGELFDLKRLAEEQALTLDKLAQRQSQDGSFPWFPGGRENRYVTQYVVEALGRLRQLGVVSSNQEATLKAVSTSAVLYLDRELREDYEDLLKRMKDEKDWRKDYRPSSTVVHYLYARAMAGTDDARDKVTREAIAFYAERAAASWLDYGLYEQALLAATSAKQATPLAATIIASLRERAIRKDEFGMYWKYGRGYRWSNLPIETHCRLLEAFRLAGGTTDELDEMRLWLLTNKRTNRWATTKSTAAAVYALLSTGTDWTTDKDPEELEVTWPSLASSSDLRTRVRAQQQTAEAKTGAFSLDVPAAEVSKDLGTVRVKNPGNDLVWGGVYWQYTELAQQVEAANDGPLTLERELFHRQVTDAGERLVPITEDTPLGAGDRVVVRLILRSDRDLDFVHLKDRRAATFEPINQLSGYRYTNGLGYYQAPGDLATNFFLDHLPRGTYTLEYDLFATFSGTFSNGLGRVQCMYAPEFGANSSGARITVE